LRKVPDVDEASRISISNIKLVQAIKWVVGYDLETSFNYYIGLIIDSKPDDPPNITRKIKLVTRDIERAAEAEYEEKNIGKSEKDKDDEKLFK